MRRAQAADAHTNAFGALAVDGDAHHGEAREIARRLAGNRTRLILTDASSFAVMERLGLSRAFTFDRHVVQYGFELAGTG